MAATTAEACEGLGCRRRGTWYLVDDNAEVTLCRPCARDLREAEGGIHTVVPID